MEQEIIVDKNKARLRGELDTNLWISQESDLLGFSWNILK